MPEEPKHEIIQSIIARAPYLTTLIYLIQTPLKALYKTIIKENVKLYIYRLSFLSSIYLASSS